MHVHDCTFEDVVSVTIFFAEGMGVGSRRSWNNDQSRLGLTGVDSLSATDSVDKVLRAEKENKPD